jgi:hypothetical protein
MEQFKAVVRYRLSQTLPESFPPPAPTASPCAKLTVAQWTSIDTVEPARQYLIEPAIAGQHGDLHT